MRADRLVQLLLLLQRRAQITAADAAEALEVSPRTARRDLEALAMAGVPVYSRAGRGGGWRLVGGATTDLSGLNQDEAQALFGAANARGADPHLRTALRKLTQALPEPFRAGAERAATSIITDHDGWGRTAYRDERPPHFPALSTALTDERQIAIGYRNRHGVRSERIVDPLGLIEKRRTWYLVGQTSSGVRTFRLDRIATVAQTGVPAEHPAGFDLTAAWATINDDFARSSRRADGRGRVRAGQPLAALHRIFGRRMSEIGPERNGWIPVEVVSLSEEALAREVAGLGAGFQLDEPVEAVAIVRRLADELHAIYGPSALAADAASPPEV